MKKKIEKIREKILSIKLSLFKGIQRENLGKFKSKFKGNGLQFKDHRAYVYGDDIRDINWNILAKNGNPYIKEYEEERNVELIVVIDTTESMLYGLNNLSKLEVCIELICLLFIVADETNDWISVYFVGGKFESLKKSRGEEGFFKFLLKLRDLKLINEEGEINISQSYNLDKKEIKKQEAFLESLRNNKNVIFFSDFHLWTNKEFSHYFFPNYWRLIRVVSPLDEGVNDSVNLFFRSSAIFNNKNTATISEKSNKRRLKYIKSINIHDDYMNIFLREMS